MKKRHDYEIKFYTSGGFLLTKYATASTKAEAMEKISKEYKVISFYRVRFIR